MRFRPCIDLLGGAVRQIVGSSLDGETAQNNFVSKRPAADYARMYRADGLRGGHVILLDRAGTEGHEADRRQALEAVAAFPGGLQVGGGVTPENAAEYLRAGASHVIVTSYLFEGGHLSLQRLQRICDAVGKQHLVLDFSARMCDGRYFIAVNRWKDLTDTEVTPQLLRQLGGYCDEFLVHAVDIEGKQNGIDGQLVRILAQSPTTVTYAGGIRSEADVALIGQLGGGRVNFTVGSALDLFGGRLSYRVLAQNYHE